MKMITTQTGKTIPAVIAAIYVKEAFVKTIQFMTKERQLKAIVIFNRSLYLLSKTK